MIFYEPGYDDPPYVKGVFDSREGAVNAMKADSFYKHAKENLDYQVEEFELNTMD